MTERSDDWLDEAYEERHRRQLHRRLMRLEPGHPDAGDLEDALEELEDGDEPA
jgi:putative component of toxin-antitoxin plasmid stabilization module